MSTRERSVDRRTARTAMNECVPSGLQEPRRRAKWAGGINEEKEEEEKGKSLCGGSRSKLMRSARERRRKHMLEEDQRGIRDERPRGEALEE